MAQGTGTGNGAFAAAAAPAWPRGVDDLLSSSACPSCFTALRTQRCPNCGLVLDGPLARDLHTTSQDAAAQLLRRAELIARLRAAHAAPSADSPAAAAVHAEAPAPAPAAATPAAAAPPRAAVVPAALSAAVPLPASTPAPAPAPAKRSSVQMLMLLVGVGLVAVALVFFLIVALFIADLTTRGVVIAVVTLLVFGVVSLLKRFKLHSTAQGIAVLAVLLVYLDVWAAQATNLLGAGDVDGTLYWGTALLLSAVAFVPWALLTGMRAGTIGAFAAVPVGAGLLAWGLSASLGIDVPMIGITDSRFVVERLWLVAAAVTAASGVQLLAPTLGRRFPVQQRLRTERRISVVIGTLAAPFVLLLGYFVAPHQDFAPLWSVGVPALLFAALALASSRMPGAGDRMVARLYGALAGLALALIPVLIGIRSTTESGPLLWTAVFSVAVLLLLDLLRTRVAQSALRPLVLGAVGGAGLAAVVMLAIALGTLFMAYIGRVLFGFDRGVWVPVGMFESPASSAELQSGVVVLGSTLVAGALWACFGLAAARSLLLKGAVVTTLFAGAVLITPQAGSAIAFLAIGGVALLVMLVPAARGLFAADQRSLVLGITTIVGGTLAGYLLSFDTMGLWLGASAAVLGILLGCRQIRGGGEQRVHRPALLSAAVLFTLGTAAWLPAAADGGTDSWPIDVEGPTLLLALSGVLLLALSLPLGRFAGTADRSWAMLSAATVGVISLASGPDVHALAFDGTLLATLGAVCAAAAGLLLVGARHNAALPHARRAALFTLPALIWLCGHSLVAVFSARSFSAPAGLDLWPVAVAALAFGVSLAWSLRRRSANAHDTLRDRVALDVGAAAVLICGLGYALVSATLGGWSGAFDTPRPTAMWMLLLIAAIAVLLAAIDDSGLFTATPMRHQLGWAALGLGTASLWTALGTAGVNIPEPYSVPLGCALLAIAWLVSRSAPRTANGERPESPVVEPMVAVGMLVLLLPSAVVGADGSILRPLLAIAAAGIVLLGACLWQAPAGARPPLAVIGAATLALVVAASGRTATELLVLHNTPGTIPGIADLWILSGTAVLLLAAFTLGARAPLAATGVAALALVWATALQIAVVTETSGTAGTGPVRAILLVVVLAAAHVLAAWRRPRWLAGWCVQLPLVLAAITAVVFVLGSVIGRPDAPAFEWATVPVAAAWLAGGALTLARVPAARSWRCLGGGLVLLLLPSLLADLGDSPLWRVVGLGVLAIAVLLSGFAARLQAPFVLGAVVLVLHAGAQLWPWLAALYDPTQWWLWLGIGGVLLIAVAARYEKRVRNVTDAVARISALR